MFLYKITNNINGKQYIGQTKHTLVRRWAQHRKDSRRIREDRVSTPLANAIQKYGKENFVIEPIYEIPTDRPDILNKLEKYFIKELNTRLPDGYNVLSGGKTTISWVMPAEATAKMVATNTGKKHHSEWNTNIRKGLLASKALKDAGIARRGRKQSPEHIRKRSEALKAIAGQPGSFGPGQKTRLGCKNPCSDESKKKISEGLKRAYADGTRKVTIAAALAVANRK